MQAIVAAIHQYMVTYDRMPVGTSVLTSGAADFTFGTFGTSAAKMGITNAGGYQANNSEVMAILMDLETLPGSGTPTVNAHHSRNPQQMRFLDAKMVSDTNAPGVGADLVYRDPWGNPYIITIHLDGAEKCRDAFYKLASVSEKETGTQAGIGGLERSTPPPYSTPETRDSFEAHDTVMVWSLGPDGKADRAQKADKGANKDNVVSWK